MPKVTPLIFHFIFMEMKLVFDIPTVFDEEYIKDKPKLKTVVNLHLRLDDGKTLLQHIPISGLVVLCCSDQTHLSSWSELDVLNLIKAMAVTWTKKIKYLRIVHDSRLYCTIYNDRITIRHKSFKRLSLNDTLINYFEKISNDNMLFWTDPPKQILDVDKQQRLEGNVLFHNTFISLPKALTFEDESVKKLFGYRFRVITPLWLTYYILTRENVIVIKDSQMLFKMECLGRQRLILDYFHDFDKGLTLSEVYYNVIRLLSKCERDLGSYYIDDMYMGLINVETIHMGKLIKCHW